MLQDLLNRYSQVRQELVQSETDAQARGGGATPGQEGSCSEPLASGSR